MEVSTGQSDGMIAGMSITDERKKTFDFSEPYFDSGVVMAVSASNNTIKTYADLAAVLPLKLEQKGRLLPSQLKINMVLQLFPSGFSQHV